MNSINPKEYLQRKQQEYENKSELLEQKETIFTRQYNQIYTTRLEQMRPRLIDPCKKWNVDYKPKLVNISLDQTCFLIGTIYMDMPLKPNVLDEITREQWVNAPPPKNKYTSDQDQVILEDESGRVVLSGEKLKQELLTTGMVIGVLGSECKDGSFCVMDIMYPTCDPQPPLHENGSWIAIVSGLHLSKKQDVRLQLLSDYITGELGSMSTISETSEISRLIVAGNLIAIPDEEDIKSRTTRNTFGTQVIQYDGHPIQLVDEFLSSVVNNLQVDVMPGKQDPASQIMPQQRIQQRTSGQPIDNMYLFLETENRMEIAKQTLRCMHMSPVCPDTLWCQPYQQIDPFIIQTVPKIYFVGNQPEFQTELFEFQGNQTRIVLVPKFSETGTIVLVHTSSLECKTITFSDFQ